MNSIVDTRLREMAEKLKQYRIEKKTGKDEEEEETTHKAKIENG